MKTSFRVEDRLEGATNFKAWKVKLLLILEENYLLDYINQDIPEPEEDEEKVKHKKKEVMTRRILVDSIREYLIPHIAELKTAKKMYNALVKLFESKNISRKLALKNQLRCIKMSKLDSIDIYLTKVYKIRDRLKANGDEVQNAELVTISLNGLPISWEPFIQSICECKKLPKFDHLLYDCVCYRTVCRHKKG
jgi:intergrase/recombinase